jgi:cell division septum initiation protein DivIVA
MSADDFKTIATEYADITKKITAMNKEVKTLKDQKDEIGVTILSFMQSNKLPAR